MALVDLNGGHLVAPGQFGYENAIPDNLRLVFADLCQDVVSIRAKWETYLNLFGSDDSLHVVNKTAPLALNVIEESLRSDMSMSFCRMTDPARQGKNENLSFQSLASRLPVEHLVQVAITRLVGECEPMRSHRDKKIGHNDLELAINPKTNPFQGLGSA
jgi:hypothetical protein